MFEVPIRGMTITREGEIRSAGAVKVSWLSSVFEISERSVRYARAHLVAVGILSDDKLSTQRKLNRTGAYFTFPLSWRFKEETLHPLAPEKGGVFAPPYKDRKTPYGSKNQKTESGVCDRSIEKEPAPSILNVRRSDLDHFSKTEELYFQAVKAGFLQNSEAAKLDFFAAAVRAKTCQARDPAKVFMGIIRKGLWRHISSADEERARLAIVRYRAGCSHSVENLLTRLTAA